MTYVNVGTVKYYNVCYYGEHTVKRIFKNTAITITATKERERERKREREREREGEREREMGRERE
jgi:hypothetical protein